MHFFQGQREKREREKKKKILFRTFTRTEGMFASSIQTLQSILKWSPTSVQFLNEPNWTLTALINATSSEANAGSWCELSAQFV